MLEETDNALKKEINKEYETLIRNRMQMKKLKVESDKQREYLSGFHTTSPGTQSKHSQHNSQQQQNVASGKVIGPNTVQRPDSSQQNNQLKTNREIQHFHRTIWEMRSVLYQIYPELKERHGSDKQERFSRINDDGVSEKSHLHENTGMVEKRFTKSPTNLSVSNVYSRQVTGQSDGQYLQAPNPDNESVDSSRTVRISEIDHIMRFFNNDTELLQDSVINELDRLGVHYSDQRYQLLSMHSLLEYKKDLLKDYQIKRDKAKLADETAHLRKLDENPVSAFRIQLTQILEKKDLDNRFMTWKTSASIDIYNNLKLKLINLVYKFGGWTESIIKVATGGTLKTGFSISKRVYDLHQEIEEVIAHNTEKYEFDVEKLSQIKHDFSQFSHDSVENQLFFDWMLANESFFMVFSHKQELVDLLKYCTGRLLPEDTLIKLVERSWVHYNEFLDENVKICSKSIKEFMFLLDRQREQTHALNQTSYKRRTSNVSNIASLIGVLKSNGVIYHDFNTNDYVASLFAEDEHIDPDMILIPADPEPAPVEKKEEIQAQSLQLLTPAQIEMEKMKQLITKVSKEKETEVRSLEFRNHFADFMKNINQSYGILKTGLTNDKKGATDDDNTTLPATDGRTDHMSSGMALFKKIRVKTAKNHVASKIDSGLGYGKKPRAGTAGLTQAASAVDVVVGTGRDASRGKARLAQTQTFDFRANKGSSIERLKRNRLLSRLNDSNSVIHYGHDSDSKIRVRSLTAERSFSNDRQTNRDVLGRLTRKLDQTSINFRARLQRAEMHSTTDSLTDIRKPRAHLASSFFDQDPFLRSFSFRNSKVPV